MPDRWRRLFLLLVPYAYSGYGVGSHTFYVKATDSSGQPVGPISYTWNIVASGAADAYSPLAAPNALSSARWTATAARLLDGTVLIAGGNDGTNDLNSADFYDPTPASGKPNGAFSPLAATMAHKRVNVASAILPSGKVAVIAGSNSVEHELYSMELFDPATRTFSMGSALLTTKRDSHTATVLNDGRVLVYGGWDGSGYTNRAQIYDPSSDSYTTQVSGSLGRYGFTATLSPNGKVLLAGGWTTAASTLVELFDPAANSGNGSFTTLTPLSAARVFHTATLLNDGTVLIAGGNNGAGAGYMNTAEIYDPSGAGTTTPTSGTMSVNRANHGAALLPNGKVIVYSGYTGTAYSGTAEIYDPTAKTFGAPFSILTSYAPNGRAVDQTVPLLSGAILFVGGSFAGSSVPYANLYYP